MRLDDTDTSDAPGDHLRAQPVRWESARPERPGSDGLASQDRQTVEGASEGRLDRLTARLNPVMTVLAILWLPVLVVPFIVKLHGGLNLAFGVVDYCIWAAFAVEYTAKMWVAVEKRIFFRHHLLDLLIVALPVVRPLGLARLLRLGRLARVSTVFTGGVRRARDMLTNKGLHLVLLTVTAIIFSAAGIEVALERHATGSGIHNFGDALWWAMATVTTVGYGDKVPVTGDGRWVAVVLMVTGIGLVGILTATIASYFVKQERASEMAEMKARLDEIRELLRDNANERQARNDWTRMDGAGALGVATDCLKPSATASQDKAWSESTPASFN
jgi:voltage-gated potassium channel